MRARLIVNADDFGRNPEINRGIVEAHLEGIVTTTTALINMPGALTAMKQAQESAPDLAFGLHLNLTLGAPVTKTGAGQKLIGKDSQFKDLSAWLANLEDLPIGAIEDEWRAQVSTFLSSGIPLDHLDSHHHIALVHEDIWALYLELAKEIGCGVRPPNPDDVDDEQLGKMYPSDVVEYARSGALSRLRVSGVPHPTSFLASFFDDRATLEHLHQLLGQLSPGFTELMCHPGYLSQDPRNQGSYTHQRVAEFKALTDRRTIQVIQDRMIELVTYRQVWPAD